MNASANRRLSAKAAPRGAPQGQRSGATRAAQSGTRQAAKSSRSKRALTGIRRRGVVIALSVTGVIAAMLVTGVIVAAPLGDAIGQAVNGALSVGAKNEVPDAPQSIVVPPQSAAVSQAGDTAGALPGLPGLADVAWATRISTETNISVRAIQAYAGVAIAKQTENPGCHLGWNTLAAIGSVESGNGTHGGSTVGVDGAVTPPIYGPALDGNGFNTVPDSDAGAIDADATGDRAVGPMQMIPQAWRNWGTDANADGKVDPQNIDDATLATANYLCHAGGDLSTDAGWKKAVAAYNDAGSYALKVSQAANRFAAATAT
ncbi:lytic transglycosylase domain-containing protein [Subtercola lobariae]|uniref:lytic transglycosylase domain-containing protein n=1 Tax=Subtercola lobariae TaxID=1588641 RepID=UPI00166D1B04|nr:lytic murein transglycosylase [Subtercola lobariae]